MIEVLFYELIRVAIGTQDQLSRLPSTCEWDELYKIAEKQSLLGICFAALRKLGADADEGFAQIGMSETLYMTWMGIAAMIHQKNEVINQQCVALQKQLSADGLRSCLLKGQGVASLYGSLSMLRQSGDIDMWINADLESALVYANSMTPTHEFNQKDIHLHIFEETEVELHITPAILRYPISDKFLQEWFSQRKDAEMSNIVHLSKDISITACSLQFNVIYLLIHKYRHLTEEGVGLRHLLDYYFVLRQLDHSNIDLKDFNFAVKKLHIQKFAGAVMWVLGNVFGLDESLMLCQKNEKEGRFLLNEIVEGGNFGVHDKRYEKFRNIEGRRGIFLYSVIHNMKLLKHYPKEVIFEPIWLIKHYLWKRIKMRKWLK